MHAEAWLSCVRWGTSVNKCKYNKAKYVKKLSDKRTLRTETKCSDKL